MSIAKRLLSGDGFAFETITVADTAIGFTAATYGAASFPHLRAVVTAIGGVMRYRYDSGNPTATVGHLLSHGDMILVEGGINVANFRAIRAGTQNGTLSVTYEAVHG